MFSYNSQFPQRRMRRMRRDAFSRRLMQETHLLIDDLIYPVFVLDGKNRIENILSMPGVVRQSVDLLMTQAEKCLQLGWVGAQSSQAIKEEFS